jgi:hypothetical protein
LHTTEIGVDNALQKIVVSNHQSPGGRQQVIRNDWPVIVVILDQDMLANYWYIMWMAISTTLDCAICEQYV